MVKMKLVLCHVLHLTLCGFNNELATLVLSLQLIKMNIFTTNFSNIDFEQMITLFRLLGLDVNVIFNFITV